jgi:Na+-driven multidrug efflux pump
VGRLQGVFRGIQDTRTPFYATLLANGVNILLAPLLIFQLHWGAPGAAWATVAGEVRALGCAPHVSCMDAACCALTAYGRHARHA